MSNDELFDCFGSDDEAGGSVNNEDEVENDSPYSPPLHKLNNHSGLPHLQVRDPNCGVCSQLNAEKSLLVHVKNSMASLTQSDTTENNNAYQDILLRTENVQKIIDEFCDKRAWMMHIGPEKGVIIQKCLRDKIDDFMNDNKNNKDDRANNELIRKINLDKAQFVCVELGTYCGYGSSVLCKVLCDYAMKYDHIDFHLFTVEINPVYAQIAKEIIDLCGMTNYVTVLENELLLSGETEDVGLLLKEGMRDYYPLEEVSNYEIDFLLIDHDKDSYLSDLKLLEKHGMIKVGTAVTADNVIFAGISDYVSYMKDLAKAGIVKSRTVESMVEYSNADILNDRDKEDLFRDGIEVTRYLKKHI